MHHTGVEYKNGTYYSTSIPWVRVSFDEDTEKFTIRFVEREQNHEFTLSRHGVAALFSIVCDADGPIRKQTPETLTVNQQYTDQYSVSYADTLGVYRITAHGDPSRTVYTWAPILSQVFYWIRGADFQDDDLNNYCARHISFKRVSRKHLPYVIQHTDDDSKDHIVFGGHSICHIANTYSVPDPAEITAISTLSESEYRDLFTDEDVCQRCRDRAIDHTIYGEDFVTPPQIDA